MFHRLFQFCQMSYSIPQEIEQHYLYLDTVTSKFKIMEIQQTVMINLQSSSLTVIISAITSCIMLNLFSKLGCILTHKKYFNKLKVLILLIVSYNYKLQFSMKWKKFNKLNL